MFYHFFHSFCFIVAVIGDETKNTKRFSLNDSEAVPKSILKQVNRSELYTVGGLVYHR